MLIFQSLEKRHAPAVADEAFPFDPTYGYGQEALLAVEAPPAPADFDAFWAATYAATGEQELKLAQREVECRSPRHRQFEVRFRTFAGVSVGAWLVTPKDGRVTCGAVVSHGYGGREQPDFEPRSAAVLFPCAPGFQLSAEPGLPDNANEHVVHGIARRETYLIRHCVASLWSSARAMRALFPDLADDLRFMGGSFGGGLGALALPWEPAFTKAFLDVPTFGQHPLRLQCPCVGSGEAVRRYHAAHPEVAGVLGYFDAATAASRIRVPVLVAPALYDPAVPPPGQFAVYNALAGPRELFVRSVAHVDHPSGVGEWLKLARRLETFIWDAAPRWRR